MEKADRESNKFRVALYSYGKADDTGGYVDEEANLPSYHPSCLAAMVYMHFAGIQYELVACNDPTMSPSRTLPVLVISGENPVTDYTSIIRYLEHTVGYGLDKWLNEAQRNDAFAFKCLVEEKLRLCQLFNWWKDTSNTKKIEKLTYPKPMSFPASWLVPWWHKNSILGLLRKHKFVKPEKVYNQAEVCYEALSNKLGGKEYFFGDKPSTLDAIVYAYLATQYNSPVNSSELRLRIKKFPNLVNFCSKITKNYFGKDTLPVNDNTDKLKDYVEEKRSRNSNTKKKLTPEEEKMKKHATFSVIIGATILSLYILTQNVRIHDRLGVLLGAE
eukprot:TRINITY_DN2268_c0_g1_i1.p1 TRINITY_DN2268_c0_g1~~TRINITY_DN2268_c0_g1_i1.p1  ORF type:complete len:330 (-),score=43.36 TRINITY_DN2268_c0_g1_i1:99-1088(-)